MNNVLLVVNNHKDWPATSKGVEVVEGRAYLTDPKYAQMRGVRVFNLCRSYRYQSIGYYVSLLATARGHKPFPGINTIQDLKSTTLVRYAGDELQDLIKKSLAPIHSDEFTLSIYFGRNMARRHDRLCQKLFRLFPAPLVRAQFVREDGEWLLRSLGAIPISDVPETHHKDMLRFAREYFRRKRVPAGGAMPDSRYSLAILYSGDADNSPSDAKAIARFEKAAEKLEFSVEIITKEDYGRLSEFDALLIRDCTNVNHYTFRFAQRAEAEGLITIDDPESILKCTNKVFLAELLTRAKIAIPKTIVVHRENIVGLADQVTFPCILKQPDSSFSQGVIKVESPAELDTAVRKLLEKSELIIAQEFMPTPFDWRVGIFDREPLYVCKYYMAGKHWQIVHRGDDQEERWGRVEPVALWQAPPHIVKTALNAANLIGDGLYGVDMKEIDGKGIVIEINDNPDINSGHEDNVLKDDLYKRVMEVFLERVEQKKDRRGSR